MINNKLLLTTPTDPKMLNRLFNENKDVVLKATLISVDFPPIEIYNGKSTGQKQKQTFLNKKNDQAVIFDVAGLIIDIKSKNNVTQPNNPNLIEEQDDGTKKMFIIANEVMYMSNGNNKLISINGNFDILPEKLISKIYANFPDLKSIDLRELEDILELSRDETAIKAFYKLDSYFTAKKYEINNNIFNLIEHQEKAEVVAKKVLLKKMVAWEISS